LQRAIEKGDPEFPMSTGRQLRDFIPVHQVANVLLQLTLDPRANGIYNCGSGHPVSLRELAEDRIAESHASTVLKFGCYPDRLDEPLAFWADTSKTAFLL